MYTHSHIHSSINVLDSKYRLKKLGDFPVMVLFS